MYLLNRELGHRGVGGLRKFTFHYVSIKSTGVLLIRELPDTDLHSTMYLLNLGSNIKGAFAYVFTFHYVSIKSNLFQPISGV